MKREIESELKLKRSLCSSRPLGKVYVVVVRMLCPEALTSSEKVNVSLDEVTQKYCSPSTTNQTFKRTFGVCEINNMRVWSTLQLQLKLEARDPYKGVYLILIHCYYLRSGRS